MPSEGADIDQSRLGTDHLERGFAASRGKNVHATAQGTDGQMANIDGQVLQHLGGSRKANTGRRKTFSGSELDQLKCKRRKIK